MAHQVSSMASPAKTGHKPRKRLQRRIEIDPFSKALGAEAVHNSFFVPYQPPGSAKRDIELVDSARRAYIARRWHNKQHGPSPPEPDVAPRDAKPKPTLSPVKGMAQLAEANTGASTAAPAQGTERKSSVPNKENSPSVRKDKSLRATVPSDTCQPGIIRGNHTSTKTPRTVLDDTNGEFDSTGRLRARRLRVSTPFSTANKLDPFSAFSYTLDKYSAEAIKYFEHVWAETAFQSATTRIGSGRVDPSETAMVVRAAMTDDLLAHAFLAAVGMRMRMATMHDTHTTTAETHAAIALSKLRNRLQQQQQNEAEPAEHRLTLPILFLAAYEVYCFNLHGARTHLQALRQVNAQEQLSSGYLRALCRNIDLFSATSFLMPPIFAPPLSPLLLTRLSSTRASRAAGGACGDFDNYVELLGPGLMVIITKIVALADRAEEVRNSTTTTTTTTTATAVAAKEQATAEIVIWSEELTIQLPGQLPGTPLQESCIIALLMWLSYLPTSVMMGDNNYNTTTTTTTTATTTTNSPPATIFARPSNSFLKMMPARGTGLVHRLKQCAPLTTPLELWILAVGVICAVDHDDVEFCATRFASLAAALGLRAADVPVALRRFLWLDNFDLIDPGLLARLLVRRSRHHHRGGDELVVTADDDVLQVVVGWAAATRRSGGGGGGGARGGRDRVSTPEEKARRMRVTNRPSNWYRLGA